MRTYFILERLNVLMSFGFFVHFTLEGKNPHENSLDLLEVLFEVQVNNRIRKS